MYRSTLCFTAIWLNPSRKVSGNKWSRMQCFQSLQTLGTVLARNIFVSYTVIFLCLCVCNAHSFHFSFCGWVLDNIMDGEAIRVHVRILLSRILIFANWVHFYCYFVACFIFKKKLGSCSVQPPTQCTSLWSSLSMHLFLLEGTSGYIMVLEKMATIVPYVTHEQGLHVEHALGYFLVSKMCVTCFAMLVCRVQYGMTFRASAFFLSLILCDVQMLWFLIAFKWQFET